MNNEVKKIQFIVSSAALMKTLWNLELEQWPDHRELIIKISDDKVKIHNKSLDVYVKGEQLIEIEVRKLNRLYRFLRVIEDQPIVIHFNGNDIHISQFVI
jgi:hypothetical protein